MCSFNIFNPSQHDIRKVWIGVEQLQTIPLYACTVQYPKTVPTYLTTLPYRAPKPYPKTVSLTVYTRKRRYFFRRVGSVPILSTLPYHCTVPYPKTVRFSGYGSGVRFWGTVFGVRFSGTLAQSRPYEKIPTCKVLRYGFGIRCGTVVRFCGMVWYGCMVLGCGLVQW